MSRFLQNLLSRGIGEPISSRGRTSNATSPALQEEQSFVVAPSPISAAPVSVAAEVVSRKVETSATPPSPAALPKAAPLPPVVAARPAALQPERETPAFVRPVPASPPLRSLRAPDLRTQVEVPERPVAMPMASPSPTETKEERLPATQVEPMVEREVIRELTEHHATRFVVIEEPAAEAIRPPLQLLVPAPRPERSATPATRPPMQGERPIQSVDSPRPALGREQPRETLVRPAAAPSSEAPVEVRIATIEIVAESDPAAALPPKPRGFDDYYFARNHLRRTR